MLFRNEAIDSKRNRIAGDVVLIQPTSIYLISITVFLLFALSLVFLTQSEYSRKEKVKGYLIPQKGLVKVFSVREGVLEAIYVQEGDYVEIGSPLVRIANSQNMITGVDLSDALIEELSKQISTLEVELDIGEKLFQDDSARLKQQISQLNQSLLSLSKAKNTNKRRLRVKEQQFLKNSKLYENNFISSAQFSIVQDEYLEIMAVNDQLDREVWVIQVDLSDLESQVKSLPERRVLTQASLKRQISELKARQYELENQQAFVKAAPESGVVTAIQPSLGSRINNQSPILSIIPDNSPLEIELLLPTSAAGFVQIGDVIQIRFDAFPYQKFGLAFGAITSIDKALILPSDKVLPIKMEEATYRVRASIHNQEINAYGKSFPLKVGMIADVDIMLEKRTLLEWILDPIYAIKGQIG
ncbi:HlyD family secretion protein [Vibrio splendidus]|uniref:HlyD family secretion protein n=2 Tax=Vibrio splendidus TaxID=29497 RepID=A0A2T5ENP1_VIBSP|nr:HlyD family secretion protein [Vibrio splendidus]